MLSERLIYLFVNCVNVVETTSLIHLRVSHSYGVL